MKTGRERRLRFGTVSYFVGGLIPFVGKYLVGFRVRIGVEVTNYDYDVVRSGSFVDKVRQLVCLLPPDVVILQKIVQVCVHKENIAGSVSRPIYFRRVYAYI